MVQASKVQVIPLYSHSHHNFQLMFVLSLLLHLAVFACLTMGKSSRFTGKTVAFMDLTMTAPADPKADTPPSVPKEPTPAATQQMFIPPPQSEMSNLQDKIEKNLQEPDNHSAIQQVSVGLSATRGYFRSLSEGETLKEDVQAYYFEMLQKINEKWWLDKSIDRAGIRELVLRITIARDGTIVAKNLLRSSGNRIYDEAVLKALEGVGSLPPLPESYNGDFFFAPIRLVAPLNLFAS